MRLVEFLSELRDRDIVLKVDGDKLKCSAPPGALTAELGQQIRERKQEILDFLGKAAHAVAADRPPLRPLGHGGPYPLSYSQQRVWFIEQLGPGSALYNSPAAFLLHGPLDVDALRRGVLEIIRRHAILRTSIEMRGDEPMQVVSETATIEIPLRKMGGAGDPMPEVHEYLAAQTRVPFDLGRAPLFRAELIELEPEKHVFYFMPHHIIWDGWSFDVFLTELKELYEAFTAGRPSPLPELPVQYADFSSWQQGWLEAGEMERQLDYWRERLGGELPVLQINTDFERPPARSVQGGRLMRATSQEFADRLTELATRHGATQYMLLLAAYKTLLCRHAGQEDILVGAPMASNAASETETMLGFFVNTIVLRTDLSGDPTFAEVLRRVRQTCAEAFSHQDVPFHRLVEELQPRRDRSRTPIHQTEFGLQEASRRPRAFGPVQLEQIVVIQDTVGTDLIFWVKTDGQGLPLALDYSTTLFAESTARDLLENLETLLHSALATPEARISELGILSGPQERTLLELGHGAQKPVPAGCVMEWIAEACAADPDRVALIHRAETLTCGQLMARVNRLARYLIDKGVGRETLVGVCLERSPDLIVALLAIFTAGGAYLPLDPTYPADRLTYMVADSKAPLVLTRRRFAELLDSEDNGAGGGRIVCLDEIAAQVGALPPTAPAVTIAPDQLAYAIYTSGSTGGPKGVLIEHRNVTNFLSGMADLVDYDRAERWLAVTSVSFDISVLEIFGSLAKGLGIVLYEGIGEGAGGEGIASLIRRHGVTHLQCTPSQARMLCYDPEARDALGQLQQLLVGGEALPDPLAEDLRGLCPCVINMYGPTETTVWSTASVLSAERPAVRIGAPLANQHVYVLDRNGRLLPRGATGELFIGGAGVTRGYLEREELTRERFPADPFVPGARMYRTGDLARFDYNGELQFLGRVDTQVKLRGHRIELGEIEHAAQAHDAVAGAIVLVHGDDPETQRLVAYVTPADRSGVDVDDLRAHLARSLTSFMLPAAILVLDEFPLTPNGKIDRRALPAPGAVTGPRSYEPPGLEKIADPQRWLWQPRWTKVTEKAMGATGPFLVFVDNLGIGAALVERLRSRGETVTAVLSRDIYYQIDAQTYTVNPEHEASGYRQLADALRRADRFPRHIVHCWMITREEEFRPGSSFFHRNLEHGVQSLTHVTQEFAAAASGAVDLTVFSSHALALHGADRAPHPEKALIVGPCVVGPRDHDDLTVDLIDLELPGGGEATAELAPEAAAAIATTIDSTLLRRASDAVMAYRHGSLFVRHLERSAPAGGASRPLAPAGGTYLISGALTAGGRAFREALESQPDTNLVLLDRTRSQPSLSDILSVDLADLEATKKALQVAERHNGRIRGVFHALDRQQSLQAVHGLRTLQEVFAGRELDFFVVAMSTAHLTAPPGAGEAAAISAFVETWSAQPAIAKTVRTIAWGPWDDPALQARAAEDPLQRDEAFLAARGITGEEARTVLTALLTHEAPAHVVVSSVDVEEHRARMADVARFARAHDADDRPRDEIERRLHQLWTDTLGREDVGIREDFFDAGGHSILAARLFSRIREEFDVEWPLAVLFDAPTIETSAALLREQLQRPPLAAGGVEVRSAGFEFLVPMFGETDPDRRPLFLVGGQFGNVLNLRHIGKIIGPTRPVYALQARGLIGEEVPHETYEAMAADYLKEIRSVQPHGPYLLGGFCSGSIAVFEMAHQLVKAGEQVGFLGLLDGGIPEWPLLTWRDHLKIHALNAVERGAMKVLRSVKSRVAWEAQRARKWLSPVAETDPTEYRNNAMRQAFLRQSGIYRTKPYPGDATLFRPVLDLRYDLGGGRFAGTNRQIVLPDNGWSPYVEHLEVIEVPGDHDSMVLEPHVRILAAALRERLDAVDEPTPARAPRDLSDISA